MKSKENIKKASEEALESLLRIHEENALPDFATYIQ